MARKITSNSNKAALKGGVLNPADLDKNTFASVAIPNAIKSIEEKKFANSQNLAYVHIPNSVTSVGIGAFMGCSRITSIQIPNSVISIGGGAFYMCATLTAIHIPNSVNTIGYDSFRYCPRLTKVYLPKNSKINHCFTPTFSFQTVVLRPHLKHICVLRKKSACRASKTTYSIYL